MRHQHHLVALAITFAAGCQDPTLSSTESRLGVYGAIFTTTADGTRVDANIYPSKDAVYLDGGPGNSAPSSAAALPPGDYYFQVTDPSGQTLLSQDAITDRELTIDDNGLISAAFNHVTGIDADHGALTVQLMPYADTPNHGGEYKVWIIPVEDYAPTKQFFGFVPKYSKTDNFKVRAEEETPPPPAPYCGDGNVDEGEDCDDGNTANGDGCSATCTIELPPPPAPCCGDGNVDAGEACDDGNTANGDGCSATCQVEVPPPPAPCCGDGNVDAGEQCDDGNTVNGDGCSATCTTEEVVQPPCDATLERTYSSPTQSF